VTWQYRVIDRLKIPPHYEVPDAEDVERYLNSLGLEGWELVAVESECAYLYLKRPKS
jgi:hypothetical protein